MKRRILISLLITVIVLFVFSFITEISIWINWPLIAVGFFGEFTFGAVLSIIAWYLFVIGIGTFVSYNVIELTFPDDLNKDSKRD